MKDQDHELTNWSHMQVAGALHRRVIPGDASESECKRGAIAKKCWLH